MEIFHLYKLIYLWFTIHQITCKTLSICEQKLDTNAFAITEIEVFCDMKNREKTRSRLISNLFDGLDVTKSSADNDSWDFRYFDRNGKFRSLLVSNVDNKNKKFWLFPRNLFGVNENVIEDRQWNSGIVRNNILNLLENHSKRSDVDIRPPNKWFSFGQVIRYVSDAVTPKKNVFNEMKRNAEEFDRFRKRNNLPKTGGKSLNLNQYEVTKSLGNDFHSKLLSALKQVLKSINYSNDNINGDFDNYLINVINNNNGNIDNNDKKLSDINRNMSDNRKALLLRKETKKRDARKYTDMSGNIRRKLLYRYKPNGKTNLVLPEKQRKQTEQLNTNAIFNKRSSIQILNMIKTNITSDQNKSKILIDKNSGSDVSVKLLGQPKLPSKTTQTSISPTSVLSPPINFAYTILPEPTNDFDTFTYRDAIITDYSTQRSISSVTNDDNIGVYAQFSIENS